MIRVVTVYSRPRKLFAPISWLIRLIEGTRFSHVAVVLHFNDVNKIAVFEASGTSVKFMNYNDWMDKNEIINGYLHEVNESTFKQLAGFCFDTVGKKYGIKQLLGMMYARLFRVKNPWADGKASYVCSELVGHILKKIGDDIDLDRLEYEGPKYLQQIEELHAQNKR